MSTYEFSGTDIEVGNQIGETFRDAIRANVHETLANAPKVFRPQTVSRYLDRSLLETQKRLPSTFDEIKGICDSTGIRLTDFFLTCCEELWDYEELPSVSEKCTDLLCGKTVTEESQILSLHTNDIGKNVESKIYKIVKPGKPTVYGFTTDDYFLSYAVNDAGLVFTGNALTCNDIKPGIPRLLSFRAATESQSIENAMQLLLDPVRSTSYHNIILDSNGRVSICEASSNAHKFIQDENIHVHTNHYKELPGKDLNLNKESSIYRHNKALEYAKRNSGHVTVSGLKNLSCDHGMTGYDGICRHAPDRTTCFAVIAKPETFELEYCLGSPCRSSWKTLNY